MKRYGIITAMFLLLSTTFATYVMAQDKKVETNDFCQQHPHLWDSEGRITLEGHKMLYLQQPDWWFDSKSKKWREWPSQKPQWSLEEHHNLNTDGPDWWYDSQNNVWKEWPNNHHETLECHKKIYLSGPQWWFDSKTKEWKPWPK
ncbi:hypothetical protein [Candidatus Nitrospira allomarina]|uniref:Uncharacterized protein n=1 Tax=Candidatus Nitrospira allomarina TaxID=3020900 RepID=A0AA96GFF3_9BACT|nr:hypothetical protein [Candidatus Nitrospira allomarina]WNM57843.1 hypothetical protein PP769_18005 [Candidatus Nitrospira allomarina]